jgi:hypothetical protein
VVVLLHEIPVSVRGRDEPALSASQRMDEMLALDDAIRKVELEAAGGHARG